MLATKNVPRLGETYVAFIHPHQSRRLRDTPEWIEVTKYAAPGNFMLGEIGRLDDVVFIETTQVSSPLAVHHGHHRPVADAAWWRCLVPEPVQPGLAWSRPSVSRRRSMRSAAAGTGTPVGYDPATDPFADIDVGPSSAGARHSTLPTGDTALPGWGEPWGPVNGIYEAIMLGDNAFGHAISLPVELRDGGVLDFGREHALAWYSIWGWGVITDSSVVKIDHQLTSCSGRGRAECSRPAPTSERVVP